MADKPDAEVDESSTTPEIEAKPETSAPEPTEVPKDDKPDAAEAPKVVQMAAGKSRTKLLIIVAVVVLLGGAAAWYFLMFKKSGSNSSATTTQTAKTTAQKAEPKIDPVLAKFTTPTTGETWLSTPKQVGDLGYYVVQDGDTAPTYYQVGAHGQSTIYMSQANDMGQTSLLYEKASDGTVKAILHPNGNQTYSADSDSGLTSALAKNVAADTTTHYDSLSLPGSFSIGHNEVVTYDPGSYLYLGRPIVPATSGNGITVTTTTLHTYGGSKLVRIERKYADTHLTAISYGIDLPINTEIIATYTPISAHLSTYTWDNGVTVSSDKDADLIGAIVRGCSVLGASVSRADAVTDSDFVAAGKTADGKTVYAFKDSNADMVQKAYGEYKDYFTGDSSVTIVSLDTFLKQHAIVAYKNPAGEWLVYTRDLYAAIGGCAKPVVYLYPTQTEAVNVGLGATVTKSDPYYNPVQGWRVVASPSGQLTTGGQTYGSLFWEGQGSGFYPGITGGAVVKHADVAGTMAKQLKQQGLNAQEASDFMAYWLPKVPNKPYVRLTWFNTAQMNELAPLHVTPKPDTVIRVFLDMDGFTVPPQLPAQHLTSVPRTGFTVVEWGGLTTSGLQ